MAARSTAGKAPRRPSGAPTSAASVDAPSAPPAGADAAGDRADIVVLHGTPRAMIGQVPLTNAGSQRELLRGAILRVQGHEPIDVPLAVALRPGTSTFVPVQVDLGAVWPPGESVGELLLGSRQVPVILLVEPAIGIEVSPHAVLCAVGRTPIGLTVRNPGNVAIPLARVTRGLLVAHDAEDAVAQPTKRTAAAPEAECHLDEAVLLEPGARQLLAASIDVPAGLDPSRRYRALLPIGPADLTVTVLPTDPEEGSTT